MKKHPQIGDTHGKLTIVDLIHRNGGIRVVCLCSCGQTRSFQANELFGKVPRFAACNVNGCRQITIKHGFARKIPEYYVWKSLRARCRNPKVRNFHRYGGRGIKVCRRWNSFSSFISDMGRRPSSQYSIERINNNGNYEPGNCRWATKIEQSRNQVTNRMLTANGKTQTVSEWTEEMGVKKDFFHRRISLGWTDERTINEPKHYRG